jgi:hypothetical protein
MDGSGDKVKADLPGFVRQLMFDAAWLAHQQCCYWSAAGMQQNEVRGREKKEGGPYCAVLNIMRVPGAGTVAAVRKGSRLWN